MSTGTIGMVWAVLSIRNILRDEKNVLASSHCALFDSKEEAVAFAHRVKNLKRNWSINVAQIPIFTDNLKANLPETSVPFHEN